MWIFFALLFMIASSRHLQTSVLGKNRENQKVVRCFFRKIMSASGQNSAAFDNPRLVVKKVLSKPQSEGNGAVVRRSIGRYFFLVGFSFFFLVSMVFAVLVSEFSSHLDL